MDAPDRKRLKSTYKAPQDLPPLAPGWTEHTAPTGTDKSGQVNETLSDAL
jgi:hypothetical protein